MKKTIFFSLLFTLPVAFAVLMFSGLEYWARRQLPLGYQGEVYRGEKPIYHMFGDGPRSLQPNNRIVNRMKRGNDLSYDVVITTDEHGRRTTVNPPNRLALHHAIFSGCSFVFGQGVTDEQTLPSEFALQSGNYDAYNYGLRAFGTYDVLASIRRRNLKVEVKEPDGIFVYVYIRLHLIRSAGLAFWNFGIDDEPVFDVKNDRLIQVGTMRTVHPFFTKVLSALNQSVFLKRTGYGARLAYYLAEHSGGFLKTFALSIRELKRAYLEQYPTGRFYVLIYPGEKMPDSVAADLRKSGVEIIEFHSSDLAYTTQDHLLNDGHPSGAFNKKLAQKLIERLSQRTF